MKTEETEEIVELLSEELSYKERVQLIMNGAISFCTILLTEGVESSEAAAIAAETAAELLDNVEYQVSKHDAEAFLENQEEEAEDGEDS